MKKTKLLVCLVLMIALLLPSTAAFAKVTIMTNDTTKVGWDDFLKLLSEGSGVEIEAITSPSNPDDRVAKMTTILASGDSSVDIMHINDEMVTQFMYADFLEPLQGDVMRPEVAGLFNQDFMKDRYMVGDNIYGVPCYNGMITLWINEDFVKSTGLAIPTNQEEFEAFIKASTDEAAGTFGYAGAWEHTYSFNEIGIFINLFSGDFFNWKDAKTQAGLQFMYDMANTWKVTPLSQLAEQYEPMNQKFIDGKHAMEFMWCGVINDFIESGVYGEDKIHMITVPTFEVSTTFMDAWYYVLNAGSQNKEEAKKVLEYATSPEFELAYLELTGNPPARPDVLAGETIQAEKYAPWHEMIKALNEYNEKSVLHGRPMVPATMEYISEVGTIFQRYILNEVTLDEAADLQLKAYESMKP
ncbi:extracellular solute-binding protein [Eubacteriales bacterium OttesenSCG-928-N13]|nr:extracellular solute-binding protein [Eubacteriales bacterium OttesenSCG-928-N13]